MQIVTEREHMNNSITTETPGSQILLAEVGSTAHKTSIKGQDDLDLMAVYIEPPEYVLGIREAKTIVRRTAQEGQKSGPGDIDFTSYPFRKYMQLLSRGNPSILLTLYLPSYILKEKSFQLLIENRELFTTKEAGERHLGYLISQEKALLGLRTKKVTRQDLVDKYGYDTKFAMHAVRLGFYGISLLNRSLQIPARKLQLKYLRDIRNGRVAKDGVLNTISNIKKALRYEIDNFPDKNNTEEINELMIQIYREHYGYSEAKKVGISPSNT